MLAAVFVELTQQHPQDTWGAQGTNISHPQDENPRRTDAVPKSVHRQHCSSRCWMVQLDGMQSSALTVFEARRKQMHQRMMEDDSTGTSADQAIFISQF